jgi:hypothetical protein
VAEAELERYRSDQYRRLVTSGLLSEQEFEKV